MENIVLLSAKKTGDIYKPIGQDEYRNLSTGRQGQIDKAIVGSLLSIPVNLNILQIKNKELANLIETFGLAIKTN